MRLAVLFGSQATGTATAQSDVDLLVVLRDSSASRVADLAGRLERRIGRSVQLVRLEEAERTPVLMAASLERGRVLVDREGRSHELQRQLSAWQARAAEAEVPLADAMPDLNR